MSDGRKKYYGHAAINVAKTSLAGTPRKIGINVPVIKNNNVVLATVLFVGAFLLYTNTLQNGFAIDDLEVITGNSFVKKGYAGIPEILSTPHLQGFMTSPNETYRPLSLVFFAAEYQFFGANPAVGHFFNVLFFGLCVILLFLFLVNLFDRKKTTVAFIAALIFAAHPIHTEVVDNIKSFDELLCFFFAFLALNIFMGYARSGKINQLLAGAFAVFLSFISKETVISFIIIVPVIFFFYQDENKRRSVYVTLGTLAAALTFLVLRAAVLKANNNTSADLGVMQNALMGAPGALSRMATAILVLGYYIRMMFVPYPLSSDYSFNSIPYAHFTDVGVWLSVAAYIALIVTAVYRLYKYRKDPWAFGILFFLVTIALFSNVLFLIASIMSERFTFFASEGFCLLIALALEKWLIMPQAGTLPALLKSKAMFILVPILLIFSVITVGRNKEWIDNFTLQSADLAKVPGNSHLNYCMGYSLLASSYEGEQNPVAKQKYLDDGIYYLRRSLSIAPFNAAAQMEIGHAFFLNKQYDSAEAHDKKALELDPTDIVTMNNLAGIDFVKNNFAAALAVTLKLISVNPGYVNAYANVGLCYYNLKKYDSGIVYLRKGINIDPAAGSMYQAMALIYSAKAEIDSTKKYVAISKKYNPSFKM